jgi:hypothetical protein
LNKARINKDIQLAAQADFTLDLIDVGGRANICRFIRGRRNRKRAKKNNTVSTLH